MRHTCALKGPWDVMQLWERDLELSHEKRARMATADKMAFVFAVEVTFCGPSF